MSKTRPRTTSPVPDLATANTAERLPDETIVRRSLEGAGCFTCECQAALDALVAERNKYELALRHAGGFIEFEGDVAQAMDVITAALSPSVPVAAKEQDKA